jgi:hypothetical protein
MDVLIIACLCVTCRWYARLTIDMFSVTMSLRKVSEV